MKKVRTAVTGITLVLLKAGYAVSQVAYFNGWAPDYAQRVDSPPVRQLALVLFLAIVVLGFIPDRQDYGPEEASEQKASRP